MSELIWLRAESKEGEARSVLTPRHVQVLLDAGFEVVVERSGQRGIRDAAFSATGCTMVEPGNWLDAPAHAWVIGLKELPPDGSPLVHRHVYFAHAYKQQAGWQDLLGRFTGGGGELFDLEYLVDDAGRRVAAFGYWAGYTGSAVAVKTWCGQQLGYVPVIPALEPWPGKHALLEELTGQLADARQAADRLPTMIVIGALGRVGQGACELAQSLGIKVSQWDMEETSTGGPFREILEHDVFINCVLVQEKIPPFITKKAISAPARQLSVICDVSCDPGKFNPLPLYTEPTSFTSPLLELGTAARPLHLCAIDHLPSLLPVESSEDFGDQLLPYLLELKDGLGPVWIRARERFREKTATRS